MMSGSALFCSLLAAITSSHGSSDHDAETRRLPRQKLPALREPASSGPQVVPPGARQRMFIIGVGFEKTGTLQGVPVKFVLPGSPAARAGLIPGCVIAEINGSSTVGRAGDDCARLIRDALSAITLRYFDPALKLRTLTLDKEWLEVPEME